MSRRPAAPFTRRCPLRLYLLSRRPLGSIDLNPERFRGAGEPPLPAKGRGGFVFWGARAPSRAGFGALAETIFCY